MQETQEMQVQFLGGENPLEEEMVNHSCMSLPGKSQGQRSLGLQRVRHNSVTKEQQQQRHIITYAQVLFEVFYMKHGRLRARVLIIVKETLAMPFNNGK